LQFLFYFFLFRLARVKKQLYHNIVSLGPFFRTYSIVGFSASLKTYIRLNFFRPNDFSPASCIFPPPPVFPISLFPCCLQLSFPEAFPLVSILRARTVVRNEVSLYPLSDRLLSTFRPIFPLALEWYPVLSSTFSEQKRDCEWYCMVTCSRSFLPSSAMILRLHLCPCLHRSPKVLYFCACLSLSLIAPLCSFTFLVILRAFN